MYDARFAGCLISPPAPPIFCCSHSPVLSAYATSVIPRVSCTTNSQLASPSVTGSPDHDLRRLLILHQGLAHFSPVALTEAKGKEEFLGGGGGSQCFFWSSTKEIVLATWYTRPGCKQQRKRKSHQDCMYSIQSKQIIQIHRKIVTCKLNKNILAGTRFLWNLLPTALPIEYLLPQLCICLFKGMFCILWKSI